LPNASADAACSSPRCWGARTVVSGLGGDEMVAVGSAESEQAALDKTENFDLPWRGPAARAALPYGDDQIALPAMAGGITLLTAECVARRCCA
jgi:hypothetical protein